MSYQKNYPNGWQSGEAGGTPITPAALDNIENGVANALPKDGTDPMTADLPMGGHRVTGLGNPQDDGDAVPLGYANGHFAPAVESADYPGCYYRSVNGVVEWLNPPMVLGVEYRTTERCEGKPVYAMRVNLGTLPNATSGAVPLPITGAEKFIEYNLVETSTSNPQYQNLNTTDIELVFGFNDPGNTSGSTWVDIHAKANHSAYTGELSMKYTKV